MYDCSVADIIVFGDICLIPLQGQVQSRLVQIQPQFKGDLLEAVETFAVDVDSFTQLYEEVSSLFR